MTAEKTAEQRIDQLEKHVIKLTLHLNQITEACNDNTEWRKDICEGLQSLGDAMADDVEIVFTPDDSLRRDKSKDN